MSNKNRNGIFSISFIDDTIAKERRTCGFALCCDDKCRHEKLDLFGPRLMYNRRYLVYQGFGQALFDILVRFQAQAFYFILGISFIKPEGLLNGTYSSIIYSDNSWGRNLGANCFLQLLWLRTTGSSNIYCSSLSKSIWIKQINNRLVSRFSVFTVCFGSIF